MTSGVCVIGLPGLSCHSVASTPTQDQSRCPITVWPNTALPEVDVERRQLLVSDGGELRWFDALDPEPLPLEWVLWELADIDLDNDHALSDLLEHRGVISWPYFDRAYVPRRLHSHLASAPTAQERRQPRWWENRGDATLEDARWWLKTARALARSWSYADVGQDPASAWDREGFETISEDDLWAQFTLALDCGLIHFRARAEFLKVFPGGHEHTYGAPRVGLYSAACRQIFNLIVNDETARRCESKTCGRIFVHQIGGATQGKYRSKGRLLFCSPSCARAETQRQYRRRESAKRDSKKKGTENV
jgi:hypothetical protein